MYVRIFVNADSKEEALRHSSNFEGYISNSVIALQNTKFEQYWKIPDQYCVEYTFVDVINERFYETINKFGNNPYVTSDGEIIEEYIFSRTTGEIFLENIDWILINTSKNY